LHREEEKEGGGCMELKYAMVSERRGEDGK